MREKQKINVVTLGCAKNIVDSEVLLAQLRGSHARVVADVNDADTVVINTCGFIDAAKQESIDAIMDAVRMKQAGSLKKVVVMGCLAERFRKELAEEIPEVDALFGTNDFPRILADLGIDYRQELLGERVLTTPTHTAFLKISEGCDHPCSFCAIPLMRGLHRTKPMEQVLAEAESLARQGVKELILIGQDTTYYGLDLFGERRLASLLQHLHRIEGIVWIRLMYVYPAKFPHDILDVFAASGKMCRYLDMPMQHAADAMLKSMRRGITNRATRELIRTITDRVPGIALRTTLIAGYPNESEQDFEELCTFVRDVRFHRLGVFTYSHEENTAAFALDDNVPAAVKEERKQAIMNIQQDISEQRNRDLIGSTVRVLVDRREGDVAVGRTEWDAPEVDQEVFIHHTGELRPGEFCDVRITDAEAYDLFGERVPSSGRVS